MVLRQGNLGIQLNANILQRKSKPSGIAHVPTLPNEVEVSV